MGKIMIVNMVPEETRMALLEDGYLSEVVVERSESGHIVGNIYKGKVKNVLPGMQAAFVAIGRDRNAFLFTGDLPRDAQFKEAEPITIGQEMIVQVSKDAIGSKGPRITTHLTLPGRYIVLLPTVDFTGISRRIGSAEERTRLRSIAARIRPEGMGIIVRTVAEGRSEEDLVRDMEYLHNLWLSLAAREKRVGAPTLLYRDVDLVIRLVRDYLSPDVDRFILDKQEAFIRVSDLLNFVSPELVDRLELYEGSEDIFSCYGIDAELEKLQQRRVDLKCGGYLVIDRTEALTVIDVNTGKFVGKTSLGDTVFHANKEAAAEIARQIRLRDIGGIIVIDFIDMDKIEHKNTVLSVLEEQLKKDRTKTSVLGLTNLGLVEMTRKKVRPDLEAVLHSECPWCEGRGLIRSPETVAICVQRELRKLAKTHLGGGQLTIQVHPRVAEVLKRKGELERLERELSHPLIVEAIPAMHGEAYSILQSKT